MTYYYKKQDKVAYFTASNKRKPKYRHAKLGRGTWRALSAPGMAAKVKCTCDHGFMLYRSQVDADGRIKLDKPCCATSADAVLERY